MNNINTLLVQFKNEISRGEIPIFRGCVNSTMENANILFHNHINDDELRYRYPLIQYKRINKCASIVCIGEGTEVIGDFFEAGNFHFKIDEREVDMKIERIEAKRTIVQVWDSEFRYTMRKWLPLSSENYQEYRKLEGIVEQTVFLQKILIGNILSMCKGLSIAIEKEISCKITNIDNNRIYTYKGVKMMGFDVEFKTNVSLPDFIGLGKGVSLGFGMIKRIENKI